MQQIQVQYDVHASSTWTKIASLFLLAPIDRSSKIRYIRILQLRIRKIIIRHSYLELSFNMGHKRVQHEGNYLACWKFHQSKDHAFLRRYASFPTSFGCKNNLCIVKCMFCLQAFKIDILSSSIWNIHL